MKFLEKIFKGNILYYPGCLTKLAIPDLREKYEKILQKINVDFIKIPELEKCCGSPALKAGYPKEFKKLAEENLKIFKEHSVKTIIANCPACTLVFKTEYPKVLGKKWDIEVFHISQIIARALKEGKIKEKQIKEKITFHDPCHLSRGLKICQEPREIIKAQGYDILEMELSGKETFCCGAGGGVKTNEPELANKIAQDRLFQAKQTGAKLLCTNCPLCYLHLKENSKDLEVKELIELFEDL
jgi:heterodisulfide reductase subunit D